MVFTSEEMKTAANAFVDRRAVFLGRVKDVNGYGHYAECSHKGILCCNRSRWR